MSRTTRVGLLAGASALLLAPASYADNPTEVQQLESEIAQLRAEVAELKGDNWLTEQRADEIRGLVQDVLADADTRASLLQSGMTAGYDNGFVIGSPDGNFSLKLNGQLQWRFIWNNLDDSDVSSVDSDRWGFENTRTKLMFSGNVVSPQWMYYIEGNFYRNGGSFTLEDAWIGYDIGDGWTLKVGQFRQPVLREYLVHSKDQLLVERSNVVYTVPSASRTQGFLLDYMGEQFHFMASFNDGNGGANVPWSTYDTEYALAARGEFLAMGNWDQFSDFTSPRGSETGLLIGAGLQYQSAEYGTIASDELETFTFTIDGSLEFDGWNLFAAFMYTDFDDDASTDFEYLGFVVQGGVYITEKWELFARYEFNDFDMSGVDDLSLLTLGVNAYYNTHIKMTADIGYGLDSAYDTSDITGWRDDISDEDGQIVFRTQLQLLF